MATFIPMTSSILLHVDYGAESHNTLTPLVLWKLLGPSLNFAVLCIVLSHTISDTVTKSYIGQVHSTVYTLTQLHVHNLWLGQ